MKQLLWASVAAASVAVAFGVVSGLVWLSQGRSTRLTRAKLYLGGLLLALGVGGSGCDHFPGHPTCYDVAAANVIDLRTSIVHLKSDPVMRGTITNVQGDRFRFSMRESGPSSVAAASGSLVADDGAFDAFSEAFHFAVPTDLAPGAYTLFFSQVVQDTQRTLGSWDVQVVND